MGLQHKVEVVGGESTWKDQDAVSCKLDHPVIFTDLYACKLPWLRITIFHFIHVTSSTCHVSLHTKFQYSDVDSPGVNLPLIKGIMETLSTATKIEASLRRIC
jgi:hypothetical protein